MYPNVISLVEQLVQKSITGFNGMFVIFGKYSTTSDSLMIGISFWWPQQWENYKNSWIASKALQENIMCR